MEIPFNLISLFLFFSFIFILLKKRNTKLPPGPWRLPLIGSLHHLKGKLPHHNLRDLARKHGPLMYLQLGEIPVVVISSPRIAKAVLKTHDLAFATRPRFMSSDIVFYKSRDISFAPYGDYWRQMRKVLTQELLSNKMLKSYSSIRKDELSKLLSSIRLATGSAVNITEKLLWFTSCMTCRLAFGKICNDRDELIMLIREILALSGGFDVGDLFPSSSFGQTKVMGSPKNSRINTINRQDCFRTNPSSEKNLIISEKSVHKLSPFLQGLAPEHLNGACSSGTEISLGNACFWRNCSGM